MSEKKHTVAIKELLLPVAARVSTLADLNRFQHSRVDELRRHIIVRLKLEY